MRCRADCRSVLQNQHSLNNHWQQRRHQQQRPGELGDDHLRRRQRDHHFGQHAGHRGQPEHGRAHRGAAQHGQRHQHRLGRQQRCGHQLWRHLCKRPAPQPGLWLWQRWAKPQPLRPCTCTHLRRSDKLQRLQHSYLGSQLISPQTAKPARLCAWHGPKY